MTFNGVGLSDNHDGRSSETLLSEMCNRDDWNRVWIVQEIGKARKIRIHYGTETVDWDAFIDTLKTKGSLNWAINTAMVIN